MSWFSKKRELEHDKLMVDKCFAAVSRSLQRLWDTFNLLLTVTEILTERVEALEAKVEQDDEV